MEIDKPGPGRPPGALNKITRAANEAFDFAFNQIGGAEGLAMWACENRTEFYRLFAKRIKAEVGHTGADGGDIVHSVTVRYVGG